MLTALDPQKVCFLIVKIRAFDVQAEPDLGGGSNASDDDFSSVYETQKESSVVNEVEGIIEAMNVDERRELIALSLVGRGEYAKEDWVSALKAAGSHPEPTTTAYLLSDPLVSDALQDGLSAYGFSCDEEVES
jgi:hypothetical protein